MLNCQGSLIVAVPTVHSVCRYLKTSHKIPSYIGRCYTAWMWYILLNELLFTSTSAVDLLDSVKSLYFRFSRIILLKKTAILLKKSGRVFLFPDLLKKSGKFFTMHRIYPIRILRFTPNTIIYSKKVAEFFLFLVFTQKKWQSFFILNFTQKKWRSFFQLLKHNLTQSSKFELRIVNLPEKKLFYSEKVAEFFYFLFYSKKMAGFFYFILLIFGNTTAFFITFHVFFSQILGTTGKSRRNKIIYQKNKFYSKKTARCFILIIS